MADYHCKYQHGGSISNLYGILVAHHEQYREIKKTEGMTARPCILLLVSEQSLFSKKKTAAILGLETDHVVEIKCDERATPLCVIATAGSTAAEPATLQDITDVCGARKLKMHVDIAPKIKAHLIEERSAIISYHLCGDKVNFFEMIFSNPTARQTDVDYLIDETERLEKDL